MTTAPAVGYIEMRIAKVVGLGAADDEPFYCVVLEEMSGDRHLAIEIGQPEGFSLAARLGGIAWRRPMTYQLVAAMVQALGGRVRQVRIDRVVEETYVATVEVDGPLGARPVDARPSDALNLTALVGAPIFVAPGVLQEAEARRAGDSPAAARLRRALVAPPMTIGTVGMLGARTEPATAASTVRSDLRGRRTARRYISDPWSGCGQPWTRCPRAVSSRRERARRTVRRRCTGLPSIARLR